MLRRLRHRKLTAQYICLECHCISTLKYGIGCSSQSPWSWCVIRPSYLCVCHNLVCRSWWAYCGTTSSFCFSPHPRNSPETPSGNSTSPAPSASACSLTHAPRNNADAPSSARKSSARRPQTLPCPPRTTRRSRSTSRRRSRRGRTSRMARRKLTRRRVPRQTRSRTLLRWTA